MDFRFQLTFISVPNRSQDTDHRGLIGISESRSVFPWHRRRRQCSVWLPFSIIYTDFFSLASEYNQQQEFRASTRQRLDGAVDRQTMWRAGYRWRRLTAQAPLLPTQRQLLDFNPQDSPTAAEGHLLRNHGPARLGPSWGNVRRRPPPPSQGGGLATAASSTPPLNLVPLARNSPFEVQAGRFTRTGLRPLRRMVRPGR